MATLASDGNGILRWTQKDQGGGWNVVGTEGVTWKTWTCLSNGGLWGSGDMGSSPSLVIFCVISGSPFPEPQSPHLYKKTMWATIAQGHNVVRKHGHFGPIREVLVQGTLRSQGSRAGGS